MPRSKETKKKECLSIVGLQGLASTRPTMYLIPCRNGNLEFSRSSTTPQPYFTSPYLPRCLLNPPSIGFHARHEYVASLACRKNMQSMQGSQATSRAKRLPADACMEFGQRLFLMNRLTMIWRLGGWRKEGSLPKEVLRTEGKCNADFGVRKFLGFAWEIWALVLLGCHRTWYRRIQRA